MMNTRHVEAQSASEQIVSRGERPIRLPRKRGHVDVERFLTGWRVLAYDTNGTRAGWLGPLQFGAAVYQAIQLGGKPERVQEMTS